MGLDLAAIDLGVLAAAVSWALIERMRFLRSAAGARLDFLARSKLVLENDARRDVIDQLKIGVAVFGQDRRFLMANKSFRGHCGLSADALSNTPNFEELLDRLRAEGRLPEQRDFAAWKRRMVALFENPLARKDETWHLPNGRSERWTICPHPLGGLTIFVEDITDEVELRSAYNAIVKTQKATLDIIEEAIAVFGLDGRLRLHNVAFARLWQLSDFDLAERPHIRQIALACESRIGKDDTWALVVTGVNAAEPECYNSWNAVTRADGRALVVSLTRLPDGATMATFSDLTDVYPRRAARSAA